MRPDFIESTLLFIFLTQNFLVFIYKCHGKISKKTTMTTFKMFKQMSWYTCFLPCIFPITAFVIVPSSVVSLIYCLPQHLHVIRKIRQLSSQFSSVIILVNVSHQSKLHTLIYHTFQNPALLNDTIGPGIKTFLTSRFPIYIFHLLCKHYRSQVG